LFFLLMNTTMRPIPITIRPASMIIEPLTPQSGLSYMNEDDGPITDLLCKLKTTPNAIMIIPTIIKVLPIAFIRDWISICGRIKLSEHYQPQQSDDDKLTVIPGNGIILFPRFVTLSIDRPFKHTKPFLRVIEEHKRMSGKAR